ncbi:hypothetical protein [Xanthomonas phage vB_XooS_NR08]|nr:hypothetical protein [Xanthomonas phage vB_XooS_NR08]
MSAVQCGQDERHYTRQNSSRQDKILLTGNMPGATVSERCGAVPGDFERCKQ